METIKWFFFKSDQMNKQQNKVIYCSGFDINVENKLHLLWFDNQLHKLHTNTAWKELSKLLLHICIFLLSDKWPLICEWRQRRIIKIPDED